MPARKPDALPLRLTLAVLLPLLLLVALAVQGMRARSKAAWDEIEEEAKRGAPLIAELLAKRLANDVREAPLYPDPPQPGEPSPLDAVLDGNDPAALNEIVRNPDAGSSPAGLPRRVLAVLRLIALNPDFPKSLEAEGTEVSELANQCPSVLSPLLLEKLGPTADLAGAKWEEFEEASRLLEAHPQGGWIPETGQASGQPRFWWLESRPDSIRFLSERVVSWAVIEINKEADGLKPRTCRGRLTLRDSKPRSPASPELMAVAPVPFGEGLHLEIYLTDPAEVTRSIRLKEAWNLGFVSLASLVSIGGLWLILTTLKRERKLNEMKGQFVASVSHELRAPVASIRLMADALEEGKLAPETAREFHRLIAREGARLSTLVGNVLDHARIEQGRKVWKMEPTDLSPLVADTLRVMQPLATERKIELVSKLDSVEATVDADAIQQALVNLLDNAIKFSRPCSSVEVELTKSDERRICAIRVKDQGPGVPKEEQDRIFERFYRPGDELRRETQGTGIGLSLVKSIAEAHKGSVTVESEPGKGSSFILQLPLAP
ncbi:HAMP domain-containing sensor histidine kinase [Haloferula sp. BvORR071]|uniref:sensor histidine kinase n=1 Tax=Haloferula sp. BvORR071 TaxID=1396141 RepID=UPI00069623EB|nr:HAMP domain-containing sensor histidine kinase [Haloferula sp. BvORR071]